MDTGQSIVGVSFATVAAIQEADDAKLASELNEVGFYALIEIYFKNKCSAMYYLKF